VRQGDMKAEAGAMALARGCLWVQVVWASSSCNSLRRCPTLSVSTCQCSCCLAVDSGHRHRCNGMQVDGDMPTTH
jgi:hypothetical protein